MTDYYERWKKEAGDHWPAYYDSVYTGWLESRLEEAEGKLEESYKEGYSVADDGAEIVLKKLEKAVELCKLLNRTAISFDGQFREKINRLWAEVITYRENAQLKERTDFSKIPNVGRQIDEVKLINDRIRAKK